MLALRPSSMTNPFRSAGCGLDLPGGVDGRQGQVEAHGFGICLRTAMEPGESPQAAADRLVLAEDRRRRALHQAWINGQDPANARARHSPLDGASQTHPTPWLSSTSPWQRPESHRPSHHPSSSPGPPQRKALQKRAPRSLDCNHANPSEFMVVSSRSIRRCWDRRRDRRSRFPRPGFKCNRS